MKMFSQKGQVALIVLVISALALTLGLSLSDKIRSGVKISKDDELLQKAFDAAESTLDNYYAKGDRQYSTGDAQGNLTISSIVGTTIPFNKYVRSDEYAFFWLVGHHEDDGEINYSQAYNSDDLTICYNTFPEGGLLVYYFYRGGSSYEVTRSAYNLSSDYFGTEGLTGSGGSECPGYDSYFRYTLSPSPTSVTPLLLIVKPVGGGSNFMVSGGNFPSQGNTLDALGTSGTANAPIKEENRWDPTKYMFFMLEGIVSRNSIN